MSHFSVAVLTQNGGSRVEQLLAPYQKNGGDNCPAEYLEFYDETDEVQKAWAECQNRDEYNNNIKQFARDYYGYEEHEGKFGYWQNSNAKWDWWEIGGRWKGKLLANGSWVNSAKIKDIDWRAMKRAYAQEAREKWKKAQTASSFEREFQYGLNKVDSLASYIKRSINFTTFAVITPDGKWHEKGEMGWWGIVSDEKDDWAENYFKNFIEPADPETIITIVDCHI